MSAKNIIAMHHSPRSAEKENPLGEYDYRAAAAALDARAAAVGVSGRGLTIADYRRKIEAAEAAARDAFCQPCAAQFFAGLNAHLNQQARAESLPAQGAASAGGLAELARRKGIRVIGEPRKFDDIRLVMPDENN